MITNFVKNRQARWERLDKLLTKIEKNHLTSFTKFELIELSVLYRQSASDLAIAKTQGLPHEVIGFLTNLVTRGYHQIYRSEQTTWHRIFMMIVRDFPRTVRQERRIILLTVAVFIFGWLLGFVGYFSGPEIITGFLPKGLTQTIYSRYEQHTWFNVSFTSQPFSAAFIMQNNIRIAVMAFAGGMAFGVYTVYITLYNGFMLGALAAVFALKKHFLSFWAMILPHGVIELTAICLASAAGFSLARAILFPGEYRRSDSVKLQGSKSLQLIIGTIVLLIVAGLIEGFLSMISTRVIPEIARLGFALLTAILLIWYFTRPIRNEEPN